MNKQIFLLLVLLLLVFSGNAEKRYIVKTIHRDGTASYKLNDRGEVAFIGRNVEGKSHIFLYSGGEVRQLTPEYPYTYSFGSVDMNDNGQVVWPMWTNEGAESYKNIIMAWDGEKVYKALDTTIFSASIFPQLNNQGAICWQATVGSNYSDIFMLSGDGLINVSNNQNGHDIFPVMNNNGWIAWHGDNRNLWDWTDRIRIAKPGETSFSAIGEGHFPKMDDNNHIIFSKYVSGGTESNYYTLNLYDGAEILAVADHIWVYGANMYDINNGHVVYTKGGSPDPFEIYMWKDSVTTKISLPGTDNKNPGCNSQGMAVWMTQEYEVYVYRDENTIKVGTDAAHTPQINNTGMIAWAGASIYSYGKDIYIAEYRDVFDVSGRVVLENGDPLAGTDIFLNGTAAGKTGADGTFMISNLDPGEITLTFSKSTYLFSPDTLSLNLTAHAEISPDIVARVATFSNKTDLDEGIRVYPNPATDRVTVFLQNANSDGSVIELIDATGKVRYSRLHKTTEAYSEINISVRNFTPGNYVLRVVSGNKTEIKKLMVQ